MTLFRPHTASLTIPGTLLGLAIASSRSASEYVLFGLWALAFHCVGFALNGILDKEIDKLDPNKRHFPLVNGELDTWEALSVWALCSLPVAMAGALLANGSIASLACMLVAVLFGTAYNIWSKQSWTAPILISVSFAALPAFAYFSIQRHASIGIAYLVAYGFALMMTQISVLGEIKDLHSDPRGWLKFMGAVASPYLWIPRYWDPHAVNNGPLPAGTYSYDWGLRVTAWAWVSRLACPALALWWWSRTRVSFTHFEATMLVFLTALLVEVFAVLTSRGVWKRKRKLALMGLTEVLAYFILVQSLAPTLGRTLWMWYALPLVYFLLANRVLWGRGHWMGPKV